MKKYQLVDTREGITNMMESDDLEDLKETARLWNDEDGFEHYIIIDDDNQYVY